MMKSYLQSRMVLVAAAGCLAGSCLLAGCDSSGSGVAAGDPTKFSPKAKRSQEVKAKVKAQAEAAKK